MSKLFYLSFLNRTVKVPQFINRAKFLLSFMNVEITVKLLKFMFSKKATKINEFFTAILRQINGEGFVNFRSLLRKYEPELLFILLSRD